MDGERSLSHDASLQPVLAPSDFHDSYFRSIAEDMIRRSCHLLYDLQAASYFQSHPKLGRSRFIRLIKGRTDELVLNDEIASAKII